MDAESRETKSADIQIQTSVTGATGDPDSRKFLTHCDDDDKISLKTSNVSSSKQFS